MPLVVWRIRRETRGIVLPAEDPGFARHLRERGADAVRINVNPLGESILSDAEADQRMRQIEQCIDRADVDYVSVKVSAIVANLDVLAFEHSAERIADRLRRLYRRRPPRDTAHLRQPRHGGVPRPRADPAAFMPRTRRGRVPPSRRGHRAAGVPPRLARGVGAARCVGRCAARGGRRHDQGAAGQGCQPGDGDASTAELHGWIAAPYGSKAEVDASYKALVESALRPMADALRVGSPATTSSTSPGRCACAMSSTQRDRIDFEMLEGMAPAQARQVHAAAGGLLMYAPVVADDDFTACLAYLTRRLDENTQPENFLRALFTMVPDSPEFEREACPLPRRRRAPPLRLHRPVVAPADATPPPRWRTARVRKRTGQ